METAPRNCGFLSLVVVERVLTKGAFSLARGQKNWPGPYTLWHEIVTNNSGCRKRRSAKRSSITFFAFWGLFRSLWSLFWCYCHMFRRFFCQAPFAGLVLRQGEKFPEKYFSEFGGHLAPLKSPGKKDLFKELRMKFVFSQIMIAILPLTNLVLTFYPSL